MTKWILVGLLLVQGNLWGEAHGPRGWVRDSLQMPRGPGAVLILPPSANPMRVPTIQPMQPWNRTVINPYGVTPGQPGFRYELEEDDD